MKKQNKSYSFPLGAMEIHDLGQGYGDKAGTSNPLLALLGFYKIKHTAIHDDDLSSTCFLNDEIEPEALEGFFGTFSELEGESVTKLDGLIKNSAVSEEVRLAAKLALAVRISHQGISVDKAKDIENKRSTSGFEKGKHDHFVTQSGGYQGLVEAMYTEAVRTNNLTTALNQPVTEIDCQGKEALVKIGDRTYKADAVICTIPLGVLRNNKNLIAELPKDKANALDSMEIALQNKVILEFNEEDIFWKRDSDHLNVIDSKSKTGLSSYLNLYKFSGEKTPSLIVSYYGDEAKLGKEALKTKALDDLQKAYPGVKIKPIKITVTDWENDPYSRGSWSMAGKGTEDKDIKALTTPAFDGKLHLAGEHIGPHGLRATVHAALLSGERAAEAVQHKLRPAATATRP